MMNVAQGHLFGTVFEGMLYGIYFTLFVICLFVFNDGKSVNKVILYTMCVMFLLSTGHLAGTIRSLQEGFFGRNPPTLYFNMKALPLNLANKAIYFANMIVGDGLLIYRLYIIYQKSWFVIAPPLLFLTGTMVSCILLDWEFSQLKPGADAFVRSVNRTAPVVFALPLLTNMIITGLIIFRIKQAERLATGLTDTSAYRNIILGVIESCIIYPIVLIITLVLYCLHNNAQDIFTGSMTQVVSIVPTLMWMQVRFGVSRYDVAMKANQTVATELRFAPVASTTLDKDNKREMDTLDSSIIGSSFKNDLELGDNRDV